MVGKAWVKVVSSPAQCFPIDAAGKYLVQGSDELIKEAAQILGPVVRLILPGILELRFGNTVGVFHVRELGTLEVTSGKWSEKHFDRMLEDITKVALALPFAAGTSGPFPYERTVAAEGDLLYHAFVYLRHILDASDARDNGFVGAFKRILADPHRRTELEHVSVSIERLAHVDAVTLQAIASASGDWIRVPSGRIAPMLRGRLPARVPERRVTHTLDTPENRFAKYVMELASSIIGRMRELMSRPHSQAFRERILGDCARMEAQIGPLRRHRLWREVERMRLVPGNSTILQRRRGYREVYKHYIMLHLATRHLPISQHQARGLLEGKDIALLYELWCFFEVVRTLTAILGTPTEAIETLSDDLQRNISRECEIGWSNGVRVIYNGSFSRSAGLDRRSYSVVLRPDIAVVAPNGDVHLLDAKFRLDRIETLQAPGDDEEQDERARAKNDDICKMHAYRDAIPHARSAWILYPGTELHEYLHPEATGIDGVGAIPLRPEDGERPELVARLRAMVGMPGASK